MDRKTKEALDIIEKIKSSDDYVYELIRKPKRSGWFHFWDMMFDLVPSLADSLKNNKTVYLIASDSKGEIVEIEQGNIVNTVSVPLITMSQDVASGK
ncbi:hypothetical protein NST62_06895 [Ureibacillus sp. FSL K6-8385]|uniref:hypothetical protein n=1 Tax=Ureibacillus sp. FSL K6-8385 TaxID=2954684 RepID=UPI0031585C34